MSSRKQICEVCLENESKYKCTKCYMRYCGLTCFKIHKEGSTCSDQAKKRATEEHQAKHQTSEATNNYLNSLNDEDVVNEEILMKLWQSPDIQLALKNKEIVDGLMALNSSTKPDADFLKFANVPQYGDFIDKCIETIGNIKSEIEE